MDSKYITATEGRLASSFEKVVNQHIDNYNIPEKIQDAVDNVKIRTGTVTKFYPYLDKFEVQLHHNKKRVLCKRLHLFGGELLDLFTPNIDRWEYDDKLKERYGVPRGALYVPVLNIHDDDSNEHLMLGFYQNKELIGLNPARPGNLKLVTRGGVNQYWIKFGYDGLDLRLPSNMTKKVGEMDKDMEEIFHPNSNEVYTKEEVDALIVNLKKELNLIPSNEEEGTEGTDEDSENNEDNTDEDNH